MILIKIIRGFISIKCEMPDLLKAVVLQKDLVMLILYT